MTLEREQGGSGLVLVDNVQHLHHPFKSRGIFWQTTPPSNRGVFFWLMTPLQIEGYFLATYTPSNRGVYYVANYTPSNRGVFSWLMTPLQIGGYLFGQTIPLQIGGYVFGQTTPLRIEGYVWGQTAPLQHQNPSLLKPPLSPSPAIPKRARSPNGACADDFVPGRALGRALACLTALCRSFPLSCRARTAHLWQVVSPQKAPPPFPFPPTLQPPLGPEI